MKQPWYKTTLRWGQTNLTEIDPQHIDLEWWRQYWRRTRVQGLVVNASGIVTYYPSTLAPYRAEHLGNRDLFGDFIQAAREENLVVLARMDINRIDEHSLKKHPSWAARNNADKPYKIGDRYFTCISGPYYRKMIPKIFKEIIENYQPDGFTDNSWSGLDRHHICYCEICRERFHKAYKLDLPDKPNWQDPVYRQWIEWSYHIRLETWDYFNSITRELGGPDCLWIGMTRGEIMDQCENFRDFREISRRSKIIMLDSQRRDDISGFQMNGEMGKLLHGLEEDILIPESMAMYQASYAGQPTFRKASKPEPEVRMWMLEGFAGGIQPWWHHIGATQLDRRQLGYAEPIMSWHEKHESILINREAVASIGLVWSQRNIDFYGQDNAFARVLLPWQGWREALIRARLPYRLIHIDDLPEKMDLASTLIFPHIAVMSDENINAVKACAARGIHLVFTGETGFYDEWGQLRTPYPFSSLFGFNPAYKKRGTLEPQTGNWEHYASHTYLSMRRADDTTILKNFENTEILPFGGELNAVIPNRECRCNLFYIPPFPIYPPETSWMRSTDSPYPGLCIHEHNAPKCIYLAADIDRCFGRDRLPDHGQILANIVADLQDGPLKVHGPGVLDCHLYKQKDKLILHILNLSGEGFRRPPLHQLLPVGPIKIELDYPIKTEQIIECDQDKNIEFRQKQTRVSFEISKIVDHAVFVIKGEFF